MLLLGCSATLLRCCTPPEHLTTEAGIIYSEGACPIFDTALSWQHALQVTFRSQEIQPQAICAAIIELGYGAEVVGVHPVSRERRVARIQVTPYPHQVGFAGSSGDVQDA